MTEEQNDHLTIDELAERTGVSSRNIRYYQTLGLLPRPRVQGRSGYYGPRHVERLGVIQDLQAEGLNLRAIGFLLGGSEGVGNRELRGLVRAALDGWIREEPREVTTDEVLDELRLDDVDESVVSRAVELRLLEPIEEDDRWLVVTPSLLRAGGELHAMGITPERSLDVLATLREHARAIAQAFMELFEDAVLEPFDARGRPPEEWEEVSASVERLRPIAGEAVQAVFHQVMREIVAAYLEGLGPEE